MNVSITSFEDNYLILKLNFDKPEDVSVINVT